MRGHAPGPGRVVAALCLALAAGLGVASAETPAGVRDGGVVTLRWTARTTPVEGAAVPGHFRLYGGFVQPLLLVSEIPARPDQATYRQPLSGALAGLALYQLRFVDDQGNEHILGTVVSPEPSVHDQPVGGTSSGPVHEGVAAAEAMPTAPSVRAAVEDSTHSTLSWSPDPLKPPPERAAGSFA